MGIFSNLTGGGPRQPRNQGGGFSAIMERMQGSKMGEDTPMGGVFESRQTRPRQGGAGLGAMTDRLGGKMANINTEREGTGQSRGLTGFSFSDPRTRQVIAQMGAAIGQSMGSPMAGFAQQRADEFGSRIETGEEQERRFSLEGLLEQNGFDRNILQQLNIDQLQNMAGQVASKRGMRRI